MAYSSYTLADLTSEVLNSLGDPAGVYWNAATEVKNAINEALREFSGTTSYWRKRVVTNLLGYGASSWVDLSTNAETAPYRARTTTIDSLVKEIQAHLCEPGSGFSGSGMTTQFTITEILQSIYLAVNRFFLDAQLPLSVTRLPVASVPPDGNFTLPDSTVYVHRLSWRDVNFVYYCLFRSDEFAADSLIQDWQLNPATRPIAFSQLDSAPLQVQLIPPPISSGVLELVSVSTPTLPDYVTPINIPDDFAHAVKYLAMVNLLTTDGETTSSLLAQYCSARYHQIISAAKLQRCIARLMINNKTVPLNPLATLDSTLPFWRNQAARPIPFGAASLFDLLIFYPPLVQPVGASLDLITTAPVLNVSGDFVQLGKEEVEFIIDYAQHYLSFKMQGAEFQQTLPLFDDCQKLIVNRNSILANQGRYLTGAFDQPAADTAFNPNVQQEMSAA